MKIHGHNAFRARLRAQGHGVGRKAGRGIANGSAAEDLGGFLNALGGIVGGGGDGVGDLHVNLGDCVGAVAGNNLGGDFLDFDDGVVHQGRVFSSILVGAVAAGGKAHGCHGGSEKHNLFHNRVLF